MADASEIGSPSKELLGFASYLYKPDKSGLRAREGVLNGRRVQYFKGKSALNALTKSDDGQTPKCATREDAIEWMQDLLDYQLIVRCDKDAQNARLLRINPMQNFDEETYYAWLYEGSRILVILGGIGVVAVVLAGVMFPLWPSVLRNGTWYLSMLALGLLGLLFGIAIVRLIIYIITVVTHPQGLWIFPNLFEDVGFFESFVPLHAWEVPKDTKKPAQVAEANAGTLGAAAAATDADAKKTE
ncbi:Translocation protein S62 [Coemansia sp. RSA 1807]|nr:Translocation protein S62 [Coemansia sp. RSA 1591]KAJ1768484.1 Translocation protein S62 [Coemansia sp. RSA 1752]KAJ1779605.1 Translocation protein S62 [Coemansia sp. RSA 1824]KAJ1792941.1 Translocation protein S62 [Coemansia sp. RSA 2167]KAJ1795368.1 Translocation protein S62 [Coemansia sp. RSA 1938]KAJ2131398.1 Translocation protein S62 [Coemansia sp. RSA 921]KAJ2138029.1 Translocation protein S62 [Coemansia sp. RSA 788]KAJ2146120.1 Translocation protein S62 [Coemansia sp. RSA 564]KAJ2